MKYMNSGILTDWLAIDPWSEFDGGHIALGGIYLKFLLQGLSQQLGGNVRVVDVAKTRRIIRFE